MLIALAAGGTGGHIIPALALSEALIKQPDIELLFVGTGKELERKLVLGAGFEYSAVPFVPIVGKGVFGVLKGFISAPISLVKAIWLFLRRRPVLVVGFGGYPSVIPLIAAWILRIPCAIHESNAKAGSANSILSRIATRCFAVCGVTGFPPGVAVTEFPNPVRSRFDDVAQYRAPKGGESLRLLIIGGSQGSLSINKAAMQALKRLGGAGVSVIHQTGERDFDKVKKEYADASIAIEKVSPFIEDMAGAFSWAHLIIARAGAMTVAEVQAAGRPTIFIPLEIALGHQKDNVRDLAESGGALVLSDNDSLADELANSVQRLLLEPKLLQQMAKITRGFAGEVPSRELLAKECLAMIKNNS